jgi:MFS family permease
MAASGTGAFYLSGLPSWTGIYLIRGMQLSLTEAGLILGVTSGVGGCIGTLFGGYLADRLATKGAERSLLVAIGGFLVAIPLTLIAFFTKDWRVFIFFYGISVVCTTAYFGPAFAQVQKTVSLRYQATATVIFVLMGNLIGAGLGPFLVGWASDLLRPSLGDASLHLVIISCEPFAVLPAFFYFKAMRSIGDAAKKQALRDAHSSF